MKLLSASSSSTCSVSSILRRLLCFNTASLPDNTRINFENSFDENTGANKENSPGIVARLMGLEFMPNTRVETATSSTLNYSPSKEGNDKYLSENCLPFLLEHEENFIVISFEDKRKGKHEVFYRPKSGQRRKRKGKRSDGKKGRENLDPNKEGDSIDDGTSCQEFIGERKIEESSEVVCYKENSKFSIERGTNLLSKSISCEKQPNIKEHTKALDFAKVEEQHCDFDNSSPVSVLHTLSFDTDPGVVAESGGSLILGSVIPRRKLPIELGNYKESPPSKPVIDLEKNKIINTAESMQKDGSGDMLGRMLGETCKLAQEDVIESHGVCIQLWKLENVKDIGAEFEVQIFERLLDELVDQLIDLSVRV